jgi:dihydrofolate synthase/folylpolyglutamate synthase
VRTLAEWLELHESVHAKSIDLGLGRVGEVAARLALIPVSYPLITVGGTNGKGSTVAHLIALLHALGVNAGAFTSPHLLNYNERIRIDGCAVPDAELTAAFERIETARGATTLTFFEYNTLAALLIFAGRGVEAAVLEVGLGGRLDATNLVDSDVAVLCSVGLDHRDWLGDDLESIGREKAGIFRRARPAVLGSSAMPASVYAALAISGARALIAEHDFSWVIDGDTWSYCSLQHGYTALPPSALFGSIQYRNAATAIAALDALNLPQKLDRDVVSTALRTVTLAGRFQIIPRQVEWILDVAHNEPAAEVLAQHLRERPCAGRTIAVSGILRDKDVAAIGRALERQIDHWILCSLPGARGSSAAELAQRLAPHINARFQASDSIAGGCELARAQARRADRVLVFGSFHAVGLALQWLQLY